MSETDPVSNPPEKPEPRPEPNPIPPGWRRPTGRGWGPGGPLIKDPTDPRHPEHQDNTPLDENSPALKAVQSAISKAIEAGFEEGKSFIEEFGDALRDEIYGKVSDSLEEAFTSSTGMKLIERELDKIINKITRETSGRGGGLTIEELRGYADEIDAQIQKAEAEAAKWEELFEEVEKRKKDRALAKPVEFKIDLDFGDVIRQAMEGLKDGQLSEAIKNQMYEGVVSGIVEGLLASGPLAKAIEDMQDELGDAITKAWEDGTIDGTEEADLSALADKWGTTIQDLMEKLGPLWDEVASALGISLSQSGQQAGEALRSAITTALTTENGMAAFAANARQALYVNVRDALIQAFIDQVVIAGALGPILDRISEAFAKIGKDGYTMADAVRDSVAAAGEAAALIPGIAEALEGWNEALGDLAGAFQTNRYEVQETTAATDNLADATNNLADASLNYEKAVADLGLADINQLGRQGGITIESFIPRSPSGVGAGTETGGPYENGQGPYGHPTDFLGRTAEEKARKKWEREQRRKYPWPDTDPDFVGPRPFAEGGLVTKPTLGLIGDAGPELIVPLSSLRNGKGGDKTIEALLAEMVKMRKEIEKLRRETRDTSIDIDGQRLGKLQKKARRVARKAGQRVE